ncbi:MAG: aspartate ammonia-lyase [Ignavibacteriota bacterium]|jgi:aspartate ammonia-lyase|nr:MAG: aspartate ammonia-lyase [Chlorobiota bacterium]MBE7475162.1 aspartate ammonia-lyase [Ignavibacteriales bacterium]MBL1122128.1 aspartate ammonia-lyase [Ignavibacteriota bacterium]MCC7094729.1 aspartate ammonia-lyase [Ignavibacteriaceae bacterium]MCE7856201.1 aspartate ammonia-lyase [Ignavibacteria bacterium CHB3]
MEKSNIKSFLKRIELFKGLDDNQLQTVVDKILVINFPINGMVFTENNTRENLSIIYEGEVELFKTTPFGGEKRLSVFGKYDFLGEGALMDDSPHSTSARATINSVIFRLSRDKFKELMIEHNDVAMEILSKIARVISRRMSSANTRSVNLAAQYQSGRTRSEHDLLGDREVPNEVYYGVQTLRAIENFMISGVTLNFHPVIIQALAMVKMAAAKTNNELGLLSKPVTDAIVQACSEIINGKLHTHFIVDMIQGGAGTSTNMNANEVIANRALEILGYEKGEYKYCHPNNHVNLSQSTNDAYPTSVKIALILANRTLTEVLKELIQSFHDKAKEFSHIIKMGRTQLQDAVPMTMGQEFEAYAVTLGEEVERLEQNVKLFLEVNMGATAIGTGINSHPDYSKKVVSHLRDITKMEIVLANNLVEATQDTGAFVMYSSAVKRLAVKLSKICNDLRLLSSGPRTGINEINLPPMQPGSSIMPGKINPVIPEVVNQIAFKVIGNDLTVTLAAEAGQLQLNVFEPIIVESLFESIEMLKNGMMTLKQKCVDGITVNEDRCRSLVENSIGLVTALNPVLGYETSTQLAKEALDKNKGVYELVLEKKLLSKAELDDLLKPENMIKPK